MSGNAAAAWSILAPDMCPYLEHQIRPINLGRVLSGDRRLQAVAPECTRQNIFLRPDSRRLC